LIQDCYTNTCPAGLTGSYEKLDIQQSVKRVINYIKGTMFELQNIVGSLGKKTIKDLGTSDLFATDEISNIVSGLGMSKKNYYKQITEKIRSMDNKMEYIEKINLS